MRITVVSKYAPVPGYGSNPRWFELAKRLSAQGHQLEIITSDSNHGCSFRVEEGKSTELEIEDVSFLIIKTLKYNKTASVMRVLSWFDFDVKLFRFRRHISPDVVVISSLSLTPILFGIYLKCFKRTRLVFEVRDVWPLTLVEEGKFSPLNPFSLFLRAIELLGYKHADLIVGTMPNLKQHVADSGVKKPTTAFHSCGIGVDVARVRPSKPFKFDTQTEKRIKGRIVVGYCGSIGLTNNLDDFAKYMKTRDTMDVVFLIAGDGAQKQSLEQQFSTQKNVIFLGKIHPDDVQGFLRCCDILFLATMPSRVWDYGQSMNKVVDYMLAGKFIIAQYEGHPSMINEADCGIFTCGTGLAKCFEDAFRMKPEIRRSKGLSGRAWLLQHHNYDLLAQNYIEKIKHLESIKRL